MTVKEMQEDVLRRFYESSIKLLENKKLSEAERNQILHETANVFGFACEKFKVD